jgi:hypothetical protein
VVTEYPFRGEKNQKGGLNYDHRREAYQIQDESSRASGLVEERI